MKKVLVTGATGFIGQCCLPLLLERGFEVHAVTSRDLNEEVSRIHWYRADLLDSEQTRTVMVKVKPSHLLHLAWYTVPGEFWTSTENLRWVKASLDLLQTFISHGGHRVVMVGTCAEYDWKWGFCSEETTPLRPSTLYGASKHALQIISGALSVQVGLSSAWGRIFFLYGPHEHSDRLVPSVILSVLKGKPAPCSHGNQVRDFLYVEDVASAFVTLLESSVQGPVNIGSGHPVSLKEVVNRIGEMVGAPDLIRIGEKAAPQGDPSLLTADTRRLREDVKWIARYGLEAGLDQTIQWWKMHLGLNAVP
ncbi:MAG: NAD(P)-dependent oxidoreductase [Deltaproteobacteria bacterium]|nr:NAD(P)-dependent oxidoreductase [Deltaproteobacteria bacterium]